MQLPGIAGDEADGDAGFFGEGVEERRDQRFLARRIDVDFGRGGGGSGKRGEQDEDGCETIHGLALFYRSGSGEHMELKINLK